jgi:effector-binding domain-containing protein
MTAVATIEAEEVDVRPVPAIQTTCTCAMAPEAISAAMQTAFATLGTFLQRHGLVPSGPPRAVYTGYTAGETTFDVAFPIAGNPKGVSDPTGAVRLAELPGGHTWRFTHIGPYSGLMETYGRITEWLRSRKLLVNEADWSKYMPMWEEYLGDPRSTPESELRTYIYLPRS